MRVIVWPADQSGCGHNRLIWPAQALAAQGADVTIGAGPRVAWSRYWTGSEEPPPDVRLVGVEKPDADVVVLQRPGRRWWSDLIPHLHQHGVRVVVDVDDDFAHIPTENTAAVAYDPRRNLWHNRTWIEKACAQADLVTVTTPALARRYGRHGRVAVLPNLVPAAYLDVVVPRDGRTLGWTGSVDTHPHDLETTGRAVPDALGAHGWQFRVIGTGHGVQERLGLAGEPDATGWRPIDDYPALYAGLDAAIVPLHRGPFNDAKSALKMVEAAALGVPVIASATPDNERVHALGVGLIARKPRDWVRHLDRMLGSAELRAHMAGAGRAAMQPLTYEAQCDRWLTAWSTTLHATLAA